MEQIHWSNIVPTRINTTSTGTLFQLTILMVMLFEMDNSVFIFVLKFCGHISL